MNLKKRREEYIEGFGGKKGKKEMLYLNDYLKNKQKEQREISHRS